MLSLSSRRAWIEILWVTCIGIYYGCRSPRGERGLKFLPFLVLQVQPLGRSPRGERGLKLSGLMIRELYTIVALLAESVD